MPKRKKQPKKQSLPTFLLWFGIIIFILGTTLKFAPQLFPHSQPYPPLKTDYSAPKKLTIPTLKIDTAVSEGGIVDGNWVLTDDSALFLPTSGRLGEGFNTIIYAHKREGLFLNLKNILAGDQIWLEDQTGKSFMYKVFWKEEINPTDVAKLKSDIPDSLTLFTCDGWFDEARLLVRAKKTQLQDDLIFLNPHTI